MKFEDANVISKYPSDTSLLAYLNVYITEKNQVGSVNSLKFKIRHIFVKSGGQIVSWESMDRATAALKWLA